MTILNVNMEKRLKIEQVLKQTSWFAKKLAPCVAFIAWAAITFTTIDALEASTLSTTNELIFILIAVICIFGTTWAGKWMMES